MTALPATQRRKFPPKKTKQLLLSEFEAAPVYAIFSQIYVAAIRDCSEATIERDRWEGGGVPFLRIEGTRQIRYRKSDILNWLEAHHSLKSTSQVQGEGVN